MNDDGIDSNSLPEDGMLTRRNPKNKQAPEGDITAGAPKRKRIKIKATKIDHTYHDFSQLSLKEATKRLQDRDIGEGVQVQVPPTRNRSISFPCKLYEMITNPEYQHIICFMPHGRSWSLLNKELLTSVVLPKYFSHSKFESFNRQVNGWGFKRLSQRGPDHKSYYHECFLRGRLELCTLMSRLVSPGKRLPNLECEPNFYNISAISPVIPGPVISMESSNNNVHVRSSSNSVVIAPVSNCHEPQVGMPRVLAPQQAVTCQAPDSADAMKFYHQQLAQTPPYAAFASHANYLQAEFMANPGWGQATSQNNSSGPSYQSSVQLLTAHQDPNYFMPSNPPNDGMLINVNNATNGTAFVEKQFDHMEVFKRTSEQMDALPDNMSSARDASLEATVSKNQFESAKAFQLHATSSSSCDSLEKLCHDQERNCSNKTRDLLSSFNLEPNQLPEDGPSKTFESSDNGKMSSLSKMKERDPLLDMFAEIYFSRA